MKASTRIILSVVFATLLSACAKNSPSSATDSSVQSTIQRLVTSEDRDFEDVKGPKKLAGGNDTIYDATVRYPGTTSPCIVIASKVSKPVLACYVYARTQSEADAAFDSAVRDVKAAAPNLAWNTVDDTSGRFIRQYLGKDSRNAISVYEKRMATDRYYVSISFAVPAFFDS